PRKRSTAGAVLGVAAPSLRRRPAYRYRSLRPSRHVESLLNFQVGFIERLRDNACACHAGHEISIAAPAWQHVHVNVIRDSRSCGASQIHSEIYALRLVGRFEDDLDTAGQPGDLS